MRNGIHTSDVAGMILLDAAYQCELGSDLITTKRISGRMICGSSSAASLLHELDVAAKVYFKLVRLFAVVKFMERYRRLPPPQLVPVSEWIGKQDKYKQHAAVFDKHRIVDLMMEFLEPLTASYLLELQPTTIRELQADFLTANKRW